MEVMVLIELVQGKFFFGKCSTLWTISDLNSNFFFFNLSDGSLESPHEKQSEHVSRSRTRDTEDYHGESSSGHRRVGV